MLAYYCWSNRCGNALAHSRRSSKPVVPKLFLIAYHLGDPHFHHVPPYSRKTQPTKYHAIETWKTRIDTYARAAVPDPGGAELDILPGAGARIKNQEIEPELILKIRTGTTSGTRTTVWEPLI